MKFVFASNYYNHHQSALCRALDRCTEGFCFVATGEMRQERRKLGYGMDVIPHYVLSAHKCEADKEAARMQIAQADAVISGAAPEELVASRIRSGKLTFRYTERPLKRGLSKTKYLLQRLTLHVRNPSEKKVYLLAAGGYTTADFAKFGLFQNKAYKWGYFPETKYYDSVETLLSEKKKRQLLWAGRLIGWKHPEHALQIAKRLKESGYGFTLNMIGSGEMEQQLRQQAEMLQLNDCVRFLGSMKPEQVRRYMEASGIFLATSDRQEGWGAVLNEAMNSGCAVVASHAIGAVPYLIENEKNGLVYKSGDIDMLCEKVKFLLEHPERQTVLGRQACETITTLWNAEIAAHRLLTLSERILSGEKSPDIFEDGPCSKAEILSDDWM